MSDAVKRPPSIPAWQQKKAEDVAAGARDGAISASSPTSPTKSSLIEHAARFLDDDSIKAASIERKKEFLKEKGLADHEIHELLGDDAGRAGHQDEPSEPSSVLKTIHDSNNSSLSSRTPESIEGSQSNSQAAQNSPPIITYPEFLLRQQKPPPLITAQRLLYALYGVSAITATAYGANKYLVEPMLESLADSRHDFFTTSLALLEKLNQKLEANVSTIPVLTSLRKGQGWKSQDDDEVSSIASDPTELFHRDIATQTSPSPPDTAAEDFPGSTLADPNEDSQAERSEKNTSNHTSRLNNIRANLSYLLAIEQPDPVADLTGDSSTDSTSAFGGNGPGSLQPTKDRVRDLRSYLESLTYGNPIRLQGIPSPSSQHPPSQPFDFSYFNTSDIIGGGTSDTKSQQTGNPYTAPQEDEIIKIKKEIRSLKGTLLSTRNFPTAR